MHFAPLLFAATACLPIAYADFIAATEAPIPTSLIPTFTSPGQSRGWYLSVLVNGNQAWTSYTNGMGSTWASSVTSARAEMSTWVASSAANYSIPAGVTNGDTTVTITGKPSWWSAIPTGVQQFKETEWAKQKSVVESVIRDGITTGPGGGSGSTGGVMPTAVPRLEGAAWAVAGAAAAVFL